MARAKVVRDVTRGGIRGFLGLGLPERRRQLLIGIPSGSSVRLRDFPRWLGLEITLFHGDVADIRSGQFFLLGELGREPTAVYAALIEDLWSHTANLNDWPSVEKELQLRLSRWGDFFSEVGPLGLSLPAQRGLFGELWVMSEALIPVMGAALAVGGWVGHRHANQDYQLADGAIEVKTSIAKQLIEVRIANERQLDDRGLPRLSLAVLLLTELETGGESLPERVQKVRNLVAEAGSASQFEEKLLTAGYVDEHADSYNRGYVLRAFHPFAVTNGFPRLLEEDLPQGVGDVSYSIDLAIAKPFEVPSTMRTWWRAG